MSQKSQHDTKTFKYKGKAAVKVDGHKMFGLPPSGEADVELELGWKLFLEKGFTLLEETVENGLDSNKNNMDINQYSGIQQVMYNMTCQTDNHSEQLYNKTGETMKNYVLDIVAPALSAVTGTRLLQEFRKRWHNHLFMSCWMRRFMAMLDGACVINQGMVYTGSMVLRTFYTEGYLLQKKNLCVALLEEITKHREDEECDLNLISDISLILQHLGAISKRDNIKKIIDKNNEFSSGTWKRAPALIKQEYQGETLYYAELKVYKDDFQTKLIAYTKEYYKNKSARWSTTLTVSDYLEKAVASLITERKLVTEQLNLCTMNSLIDACEDMILRGPERSYLQFILSSETGVGYMLIQDKFDDLRNMHTVLSNISEQQPMADAMRDHIIACGEKIILVRTKEIEQVFSKKKSDEYKVSNHYIDHLLDLHRKYFALIRDEFNNDVLFQKSLVQAFQILMKNEPSDHVKEGKEDKEGQLKHICGNAEMLAAHIDHIYRHSDDFDTRDDLEKRLFECADLFDYLTEKDYFIGFHTKYLSSRLLSKSFSTDEEKYLIGQIKIKQGPQFTNTQETMIADLEKYTDSNNSETKSNAPSHFKEHFKETFLNCNKLTSERWKGDEFNIKLLTDASWPKVINPPDLIIPQCIRAVIEHHQQFYKSFEIHSSRKLLWSHMLGEIELSFLPRRENKKNKTYRITMTPLQAYVCLSFESFNHQMTGSQLNALLNFDGDKGVLPNVEKASKLKRILHAFCFMKKKKIMLCLDADGEKMKKMKIENATFQCDINFKAEKNKFKMPRPKFDAGTIVAKVNENRKDTIDACIVRIMKSAMRKTQQSLITEVLEQLTTFQIDKFSIKPRIQGLIDKEYLERSDDNHRELNYLA